ncbi:hypothetical protein [Mycobacterium sp. 1423905.2]|uniref:hypothetical protein n=1 Tax=Mycobacterium sp. 1423905.2 TaxID=1856859 RepID=UPI0020A442F2|nr:hypothetical protein [Mycobacterium sp. 1423905.2]
MSALLDGLGLGFKLQIKPTARSGTPDCSTMAVLIPGGPGLKRLAWVTGVG